MYLVVECTTTSAPRASGCCRYGLAKVLSTTSRAPAPCAISATRRDVGDAEQRVGGRLHPDRLRTVGAARPVQQPGRWCRRPTTPRPSARDLGEEPEGAAVGVVGDHDVVARHEQRTQQAVLGGQAGGEGEAAAAALQGGEVLLQGGTGRVRAAAVLVAAAQSADAVLLVRGHLVDGRYDRPGRRVGGLPRVDREGLEALGRVPVVTLVAHEARVMRRTVESERLERTAPPECRTCRRARAATG